MSPGSSSTASTAPSHPQHGWIADAPAVPQQQQVQSLQFAVLLTRLFVVFTGCIQDATKGGLRCQKCLGDLVVNKVCTT
jgi:hypothetical protein